MSLLAIAFPELSDDDFRLINNVRNEQERLSNIVKPHFTLVFPVNEFTSVEFGDEIKKQLLEIKQINFAIRCATISRDSLNGEYHIFLVPDEGYSCIVKMHDKLYSDKLLSHLRIDVDFIPHITIGSSADSSKLKRIADEWNRSGFEIKGIISSVDIVNYENDVVDTIEKVQLMLSGR